jgi:hypothetical protein
VSSCSTKYGDRIAADGICDISNNLHVLASLRSIYQQNASPKSVSITHHLQVCSPRALIRPLVLCPVQPSMVDQQWQMVSVAISNTAWLAVSQLKSLYSPNATCSPILPPLVDLIAPKHQISRPCSTKKYDRINSRWYSDISNTLHIGGVKSPGIRLRTSEPARPMDRMPLSYLSSYRFADFSSFEPMPQQLFRKTKNCFPQNTDLDR